MSHELDFEGDPIDLVEGAFRHSESRQNRINNQAEADYLSWEAYLDMANRNQDMPNVSLPKIYSIVELMAAQQSKALFGRRPVIPWQARREEFEEAAEVQTEILDELLTRAGFNYLGPSLIKMKILMGISYMSATPYFKMVTEKTLAPNGEVVEHKAPRLRLKLITYAPWEVYVDPHATGLEETWQCRYVIKIRLVSKRDIKELNRNGGYPGLDIGKLDETGPTNSRFRDRHVGHQILSRFGMPLPRDDNDVGILMQYESPDRYIDYWNGRTILRDIPNPFDHGLINLSRMIHSQIPHTQAQFYGKGEAKSNEVQQAMLNDMWNIYFASHGMNMQPMIMYRKSAFDSPDDIVFGFGQRVPVSSNSEKPISGDIVISSGNPLPNDHQEMTRSIERNMDLTAGNFAISRGEDAPGADTATEVTLLKESGDSRTEQSIKLAEQIFLPDFGKKVSSIIEQSSDFDDIVEIVGLEKAVKVASANPLDLPGGHNMLFEGSDSVVNKLIKQRNLRELADFLSGIPNAKLGGIADKLLALHDFEKDERGDMIFTDLEMGDIRALQIAMSAGAAVTGAGVAEAQSNREAKRNADNNGGTKKRSAPNEGQEALNRTKKATGQTSGGVVR